MRNEILRELSQTMKETLPYFNASADKLSRSYAVGKWTMRDLLLHISDTEAILLSHIRQLATMENPCVLSLDPNRWSQVLFYHKRDLLIAKAQYEVSRLSIIELASELDDSFDSRSGTVFAEESGTSIGGTLPHVVHHNQHHLEQIRSIEANKAWTP